MSDEQEVARGVLDAFSVQCQHIEGQTCFVPTEAVRRFVDVCQNNGLVLAHGEVHAPQDGFSPVLAMIGDDVLKILREISGRSGTSIPELAAACISSVLTNENVIEKLGSMMKGSDPMMGIPDPGEMSSELPAPGSGSGESYVPATESDEPPAPWSFEMDYGTTSDKSDEFDYEPAEPKPLPAEKIPGMNPAAVLGLPEEMVNQTPTALEQLRDLIGSLHEQKESDLFLALSFPEKDRVDTVIQYPALGFDIHESFSGDFEDSLDKAIGRIHKWGSVAFAPKLEAGETASAQVSVEILGFDKTKGKYKAKVGGNVTWLDPEVVGA